MTEMNCPSTPSAMRLRAPEPQDVDRMYLWENDPEMWRYGYSPAPLSRHQIWEYVTGYDADPLTQSQLRLMMETAYGTVGSIDLYNLDMRNRRAFIGIMTAPEHRRKGYATEALRLMADYCRHNLGLERVAAVVADDNPSSLALFRKAGFTVVATLPSWVRRDNSLFVAAHILILTL